MAVLTPLYEARAVGSRYNVPPFVFGFLACDFALAVLYLTNFSVGQPSPKLTLLVDLSGEANLPAWYSSMKLFLVAVLLAVFAYAKFDRHSLLSWTLLGWPLVFAALSFDETAEIHEWLGGKSDMLLPGGTRRGTIFHNTGIWLVLLGVPFTLFMIGLFACLRRYLRGRPEVAKIMITAMVVYIGSAVGIEMISNFVPTEGPAYVIQVASEELGEMIGITLFVWGAFELLRSYGYTISFPESAAPGMGKG